MSIPCAVADGKKRRRERLQNQSKIHWAMNPANHILQNTVQNVLHIAVLSYSEAVRLHCWAPRLPVQVRSTLNVQRPPKECPHQYDPTEQQDIGYRERCRDGADDIRRHKELKADLQTSR